MVAAGAKRYLVWRQAAQSALTPQVFVAITHALEALNVAGHSHARWQARCSVFQHTTAAAGSTRDAYLVSLSGDAQAPGYIILRAEKQVVEAEASIFEIFDRTGLYKHRMALNLDGFVYAAGDFALRLGRITGQSRLQGVVLEVEYLPAASFELAKQPLDELLDCVRTATSSLPGSFAPVDEPRFADYGLSATDHSGRHSALSLVHVIATTYSRREAAPGAAAA